MRVLMLGWEYPPRITGGLGTACEGIARGLVAAGAEVTLVLPSTEGVYTTRAEGVELIGVEAQLAPYARPGDPYAGDLLHEVDQYAVSVRAIAATRPFDLIYAHDWMTWPAAAAAREANGCPFVAHVHSLEFDRNVADPNATIEALESGGLRAADRIVCVSRYTAERIARRYGIEEERARVIHNAVAFDPSVPPPAPASPQIVLFLGRVTHQKNPARFLQAAAGVAQLEPHAHFTLAGEGSLLPAMKSFARELGIADRTRFPGFVPPASRDSLMRTATLLVMPSLSEPFGIVPLEALAAGLPSVVSRQSGVTEVLHSCLTADSWDQDAWIEAIVALLRRPALRRQLVEDGRHELESLRWDLRGEELRALFTELVA